MLSKYKKPVMIFLFGFAVGFIILLLNNSEDSIEKIVNIENRIVELQKEEIISNEYVKYVLWQRVRHIVVITFLVTTWIGTYSIIAALLWYGYQLAEICVTGMVLFGIRSVLFIPALLFPHYLVYVPTMLLWFRFCEELGDKKSFKRFIPLIMLFLAGVFLEGYMNPYIIMTFLHGIKL